MPPQRIPISSCSTQNPIDFPMVWATTAEFWENISHSITTGHVSPRNMRDFWIVQLPEAGPQALIFPVSEMCTGRKRISSEDMRPPLEAADIRVEKQMDLAQL